LPGVAFAANFLWVMVIGLLGPAIPGIIRDLGISYTQAGLFFTVLALGSLIGTSLGAIASDYVNKKILLFVTCCFLVAGLIGMGFAATYLALLIIIFLFSTLGSPIGAVGQSIMLGMFPDKREKYLSYQTVFAAVGSFLAPILVTINFSVELNWRWSFMEAGFLGIVLCVAILFVRIPAVSMKKLKLPLKDVFKNRRLLFCAVIIFLAMAVDIGFSYWLAEYFNSELHMSVRFASAVVGIYLGGIITGRSIIPVLLKSIKSGRIILYGLVIGFVSLSGFIFIPTVAAKVILCFFYGLGIGPLFPLMMAKGAELYPEQPGAVTGILFASMSLGGMVFPLLLGRLAETVGIANSYLFSAVVLVGIFVSLSVFIRKRHY
jgi:FSR family fosmidomycin resistance protein-like MFS transporter